MKRLLQFFLSLAVSLVLALVCNQSRPFNSSIPAIGPLLSPFTGFWQNAEAVNQPNFQAPDFDRLSAPAQVVFDQELVPHIFAENVEDAFFIQGFVTAKYRLWQMDIAVRAVSGQLSEVMGEATLSRDKWQRRKGLLWAAERTLEVWKKSPEEMKLIQAYTDGVNAYIEQLDAKDYPIEFKLLGYTPQRWTNLHAALFMKSMAEMLCARNYDLAATNAREMLGQELFNELYPLYNPHNSPIIPEGTEWEFEPVGFEKNTLDTNLLGELIPHRSFPQPSELIGSNNWAVAGSKTESGYPILCNDPHLQLSLPSIWYEIQLHTPDFNVYGVSLPGIPGVVIGFNEHVAWGMTNVGQDVLDWYSIDWVDDQKKQYYLDGKPETVKERVEEIKVRDQQEVILDTVTYTYWGPIVYQSKESEYQDMAMRWIVHDPPTERTIYELGMSSGLASAKSFADYSAMLQNYDAPPQNVVFASKTGDIALKVNGRFPLKRQQQGRFVQDGSLSSNGWQGYVPMAHVPTSLNPERGFVASANQRSTDDSYPYPYHGGFDDYRGRYINQRLDSLQQITVQDMMALQNDNYSLKAKEGLDALLLRLDETQLDQKELQHLESLKSWDRRFESASVAAVLFEEWFDAAYTNTFDEIIPLRDSMELLAPEEWRFIDMLVTESDHLLFDQKESSTVEDASAICTASFKEALAKLEDQLQKEDFNWSTYKSTQIRHLGRIPAFSVNNVSCGGYGLAPNAIKSGHGPSWRMIVAFGEGALEAYGMYPGGQSGNPGSPFYDDRIEDWAKGQYHKIFFMQDRTDERQEQLFSVDFQN